MKIIAKDKLYRGDKGWDSDPLLFASSAIHPKSWLGQAAEHIYAAQILLPHIKQREALIEAAMEEKKPLSLNPSLTGVYFFHCALAMENSIKSLISHKYSEEIKESIKSTSKTPKLLLGHDLIDLAKRINYPLDIDQEYILAFLTRYGIWSGKYHQPIKNSENGLTKKLSDGKHYLTGAYSANAIPSYFEFCLNFYNESQNKVIKSSKEVE